MKSQNPSMCKGKTTPSYNGPEICATLTVIDMIAPVGGEIGPREKKRTVKVSGRLNNPRKSEQAVLTEICAKVKAENPTAKLVSFKRKEGRA
jgi:hypothetical protein